MPIKLKQPLLAVNHLLTSLFFGLLGLCGCHQERFYMNAGDANIPMAAPASQSKMGHDPFFALRAAAGTANTDEFHEDRENDFISPRNQALSTFSIDVDTTSYTLIRKLIRAGERPPKGAVRLEEMLNFFTYNYPEPKSHEPLSVTTELAECPWNPAHQLLLIALKGRSVSPQALPPSNFVFLVDVSGSMESPDRLPLVKHALRRLTASLRPEDTVSLVAYAGNAGLVLPPTSGEQKDRIVKALENLESGGPTAGAQGIRLAYSLAKEHFVAKGNNRVILATDGDFNVGVSSTSELEELIASYRNQNIYLSVLGFGMGNYKDNRLESLADKGNGNYAYIDSTQEADRVFGSEYAGTLFSVAKDVKLQVEFNPKVVGSYRLLGYENRLLTIDAFQDDKKDAGELGAGQSVTALYEVTSPEERLPTVKLRYQKTKTRANASETAIVHVRYQLPEKKSSLLRKFPVPNQSRKFEQASENLRWAAAVASFGMTLRDSAYKGSTDSAQIRGWAQSAKGSDENRSREEFLTLIDSYAHNPASMEMQKSGSETGKGDVR